ncbi:MAG: glycosyltransferase family 4 protein [Paracoccaceae bacterium]|nr:glycosyltransferase family 4 protein [Paracoccaceae bacterium]
MRARAESDLRRFCIGRARPAWLARLLRRHLPVGTAYLNVGHSNLSPLVLDAVGRLPGRQITVMVHDTIPLDHPDLSRPDIPERFAGQLKRVGAMADLVIYNSAQSQRDAERHFRGWGPVPDGVVAALGVEVPRPDPAALPAGLDLARPYFVTLGTIEPRKNLGFLLDLWEAMATDPPPQGLPRLFIVGRRGWAGQALFDRLDALPKGGAVQVLGGLPDGATAALLQGAAGLLFPSLAEGYGLPPLEAAALGVPVVCNDLPIYRETLGDSAVYAPITESYSWRKEIINLLAAYPDATQGNRRAGLTVPTWADHFGRVLTLT